jgi:outer membrane lipopolysaccharide assembly protein LptE/RlpB
MKNLIFFTVLTFLLTGCGITKSSSTGVENQAFILIVGTPSKYPEGVKVVIDDKTKFNSEVHKNRDKVKHLRLYGISTGKHKISILKNNKTIYEKLIFLSSQQTKKIILP